MTVSELRHHALECLILALNAGERGQIAAAERLTAKAAQFFDDADVVEAAERRVQFKPSDEPR